MNRILLIPLVLLIVGCPAAKERPAWPNDKPEVDTLKVRESVVSVDRAISNKAKVKKDRLTFPASMSAQVMSDWPVGKVVLGQPAEDMADKANNPFGFMRKVKAVNVVGNEVVVETENAKLDDVLDGQFHKTMDFSSLQPIELPEGTDLSAYDVPLNTSMGTLFPVFAHDAGTSEQPLLDNKNYPTWNEVFATRRQAFTANAPTLSAPEKAINILSFSNKTFTPEGNPDLEIKVSGNLDFTPILNVTPSVTIDYDWSTLKFRLEEFEFSAGANGKLGGKFDTTVSIVPKNPRISAEQYTRALRAFGIAGLKYPIPKIPLGTVAVSGSLGPIPIVAKASAFLECTDAFFKGTARVKAQAQISLSPRAGIHYTRKDGWEPVIDMPFRDPTYSAEVIGNSAALQIDCGAYLRVEILAAGVAGPYAQLRRSFLIDAERKDECDERAKKDHQAAEVSKVDVRMYDTLQVGAEIDLIVASIEKGPYDLTRREYKSVAGPPMPNPNYKPGAWWYGPEQISKFTWEPIWSWSKTRPGAGATKCEVTCDDGVKTAPDETDVDCGGQYCSTCRKGKACVKNTDCLSNQCLANNTCQGIPCDDDAKGQDETDIDCGGATCNKCTAGKSCLADRDCQSGVCGGNGKCVPSLCEDGVKNAQETDVDCGGPTCLPCALDKVCSNDADCAGGLCSNDGVTPRTCTDNLCRDGRVSGSESDVDCGASMGCTKLCAFAYRCNTDADCASGACNLNTHACAQNKCADGRTDDGETDVDCGGPCQAKCAVSQGCNFALNGNADCTSGQCANTNMCVATACENKRVDTTEVGTDCAGACSARCPFNETCTATADCESGLTCHPLRHKCQLPGCDDAVQNGQETAIDCGGPTCSKCALSKSCAQDSDCVSGSCFNNRCISGPCENGVKDATEADVDCGGSCGALKCSLNKACSDNADCKSNICANGKCISDPCFDLVRNAAETDIDCGGNTCAARCQRGATCVTGTDCASGQCNGTTLKCAGSGCEDGIKSGTESDVDCGGSCSTKCAVNRLCSADADCVSSVCNATSGRCVPDRCADGVKNGDETALDCGGSCEAKCGFSQACARDLDCQSGACSATSTCAADQCSNSRLDGYESAVDCGGTCATKCAIGAACVKGTDCVHPQSLVGVPGFCATTTHTCVTSSCSTGIVDGDETDVDCGGSCSTKCANSKACLVNTDCVSDICHVTRHTCSSTQRDDGIKNGSETDIDCGGPGAPTCAQGKGCVDPWDCSSGYCGSTGLCLAPIPRTCENVQTRVDGLYLIDPDGPRVKRTTTEIVGLNRPIISWCRFQDGYGFTPVYYLNSEGLVTTFPNITASAPNTSGYVPLVSCSSDSYCQSRDATEHCRHLDSSGLCPEGGGSDCYCTTDETWPDALFPPAIRQNPTNLSVSQPQLRDKAWFQYELTSATTKKGFAIQTPFFAGRPYIYRLTAYRNGTLIFDSHYFTIYDLASNQERGYLANHLYWLRTGDTSRYNFSRTGSEDMDWLWCGTHSLQAYPSPVSPPTMWYTPSGGGPTFGTPPAPWGDTLVGGLVPRNERCHGIAQSPIGGAVGSPERGGIGNIPYIYGFMRERPRTASYTRGWPGYTGLWWGAYGQGTGVGSLPFMNSDEAPRQSRYMGICNGMQRQPSSTWASAGEIATQGTPCLGYHHLTGQSFQWYTNELSSDAQYGSVFEEGVPGLVFILWAN